MNLTHAHLYLNHLPIIGSVIVFIFLGYAVFSKRYDLIKLSLWFLLIIALVLIPVYLTGDPAEETLEKLPDWTEGIVENHEEAA